MRGLHAPHSVGVRPVATQPRTDSTDISVCSPGISLLHDVNQTARFWPGGNLVSSQFGLSDLLRSAQSRSGGARRDRTDDLLLAKQALSQLSYGPVSTCDRYGRHLPGVDLRGELEAPATNGLVGLERFELSTSRLSSARSNQLSYRPGKRGRCPNEERETKAAAPRMHSKNRSDS
jgi:hypothetical protein